MRVKRTKAYKKVMKLYQQSFGFREPYQVLVSADFLLEGVAKNLEVIKTLEDALQGKVKPLITFCSIRDVREEGEHRSKAIAVSKGFEKRRCPHKDPVPGSQCISEILGDENRYNYCVAVQDEMLRARLRKVPGVPLVCVKQSTMVLEKPQDVVKQMADSKSREKLGLSDLERKMLEAVKKKDREEKLALMPPKHKKKKKGPKGPNPLSMKKSKKGVSTPSSDKTKSKQTTKPPSGSSIPGAQSSATPAKPSTSAAGTKRGLSSGQEAPSVRTKKIRVSESMQQPTSNGPSQSTSGQQQKSRRKRENSKA
ncbi:hypothetical protein H4217_002663 [Coemansia sp. RSA 1939]|nr:hypothetical protein H4217_002663 [Coemansia sp. RSA 1939]